MSEREVNINCIAPAADDLRKVTFELSVLAEGANLETLRGIIERHKADQEWLDRLPESSRVLYQNQIPIHEDRGTLLRMFTNADIEAISKGEKVIVEAKIGLLSAELTRITDEARRKVQPIPPPCAFPDKGLTLCGAINHPNGLTTCDVIGCPRMAKAQ